TSAARATVAIRSVKAVVVGARQPPITSHSSLITAFRFCRFDKGVEETLLCRVVCGGDLRMPLNGNEPGMISHFYAFDDPISGRGNHLKRRSSQTDGLMM